MFPEYTPFVECRAPGFVIEYVVNAELEQAGVRNYFLGGPVGFRH